MAETKYLDVQGLQHFKSKLDALFVKTVNNIAIDAQGNVTLKSENIAHGDSTIKAALEAINTTLDTKVDKVDGKGLSTNDYDADAKAKLDGLANIKSVASPLKIDASTGELSVTLDGSDIPVATATTLGGVMIGDNVTVADDGKISVTATNVNAALGYTAANDAEVETLQGYFEDGKAKTAAAADTAATATNATQLEGHAADYFATADEVTALKKTVSSAINYKGSVTTLADLSDTTKVSDPQAGDMYNVTDTDMNYVYVADTQTWDPMSPTFTIDAITDTEIDAMF